MTEDTSPTPEKTDAPDAPAPAPDASRTPEATSAPPAPAPAPAPSPAPAPAPARRSAPQGNFWWGTGRRKSSVARVRIRPGPGTFTVNHREFAEFFTGERDRKDLIDVLEKTNTRGTIDIHVNVSGGGYTGQAGAILLGLGRALNRYDPSLEPILRDNNFLTRDPREVERKKYGQAGARRKFQFSKR